MRKQLVLIAAGAMSLGLTGTGMAQSRGLGMAIVPFGAFNMTGVVANETSAWELKPKATPLVGVQVELGVSKTVSVGIGGSISIGQKMDLNDISSGGSGNVGTADISSPRIYGMLSIRPSGRKPGGAVTPLAIELGGGVTMWRFDKFVVGTTAVTGISDWNGTEGFAFAGIAYNMPIGPRASVQLFGRAVGGFGYSSKGLDSFNASPPPSNVKGKFNIGVLIGAGIRVGR